MSRTTEKQVRGFFEHFAKACGKRVAKSFDDVGAWRLDYVAEYGGWNIEEISSASGSVKQPFGIARHKSEEMWKLMRFGMDTLDAKSRSGNLRRSRRSRRSR